MYVITGHKSKTYETLTGDGSVDEALALQNIVNNNDVVILPDGLKLRLKSSIEINIETISMFDGGNSVFIVDGSFPAFVITGSVTTGMSANPTSLSDAIKEDEAAFTFKNCKIIGESEVTGDNAGIKLSGCFKTKIENCYFYNMTDGIIVENYNRDLMLSGNHIYGMTRYGLHIKPTANLHQFNFVNNMISYCQYCIYLDNPEQIANWQCTGNDIEISTYPNISLQNQRCIMINSDSTKNGQLSEIEIVGNTIQGHSQSTDIIEINGGTNRYIQLISICGNQISNSTGGSGITMSKVNDTAINGNTFKDIVSGVCVEVVDSKNIAIVGNTFDDVDIFSSVDELSQNVVIIGNSGESTESDGSHTNMYPNSGRKMATIGDSICKRGWWQKKLQKLTNIAYTDYSENGSCIAKINSSDTTYFSNRVASMDNDFDMVIVWGGLNDFGYNFGSNGGTELGTATDSTVDTFYGALNVLCDALAKKYKRAKIAFVLTTPIATLATMQAHNLQYGGGDQANTKGFYFKQYMDAIKEVCEKYSYPVLDLYNNSGFTQDNITIMTSNITETNPDGLHPSKEGFDRIINQLALFIGNL